MNLKAGVDAEALEEYCTVACSAYFLKAPWDHPPRIGAHSELDPPPSINGENAPQTCPQVSDGGIVSVKGLSFQTTLGCVKLV